MINLVPQCAKCGSPVSDLVEPEIQEQGEVKPGHSLNSMILIIHFRNSMERHLHWEQLPKQGL